MSGGEPRAAIVMAEEAVPQVRAAGEELRACIREATGAELPVVAARPEGRAGIHVGPSAYVDGLKLDLSGLDADGFLIAFPDAQNIVVLGPSDYGTEFGVYEFLERYAGVRWLMPGPDGADIPRAASLAVEAKPVRQQPAFFSRLMSGFRGADQTTWARRNRMHGRVSFHHNLRNLFPFEKYAKSHPEFYPVREGKRLVPTRAEGWQPCLTAPGIVDEAVKNICEFFDRNPQADSFSLGMNDNPYFCQCPDCLAKISGEKNFLDWVDYSDLYYDWANRVIEGVLKKHPDKFFGCLAYTNLVAPPQKVGLHPRLIPFMTYDRNKWIDPEIRAAGERLTVAWHKKSPMLGWYDYIYGRPYLLPRVWFHPMAEYYRYGYAQGVRAMYAEAYPNWGEGPKLYVALRLQWDPARDVDAMLREWYERCVGTEAAPLVAEYFAHWEDFWTRRILASPWFPKTGQYLPYSKDPSYLLLVTPEELARCRDLLQRAVTRAKTDGQRARAKVLLDAFEYYECSALVYLGQKTQPDAPRSDQQAIASLEWITRGLDAVEKRGHLMERVLVKHPVLLDITERPPMTNDFVWTDCLLDIADWSRGKEGPVRDALRRLARERGGSELARAVEGLVLSPEQPHQGPEKLRNAGFEEDSEKLEAVGDRTPPGWTRWARPETTSQIRLHGVAARTGRLGVFIRGATAASVLQRIPVQPGETYLASAYLKGKSSPNAQAKLTVSWQDVAGKWVTAPGAASRPLPVGETADWGRRCVLVTVPEGAQRLMLGLSAHQQGIDDYACFDDVALRQISAPTSKQ